MLPRLSRGDGPGEAGLRLFCGGVRPTLIAAPRASEAPLPYGPDALLGDVHERLVADVLHEDLRGLERTIAAKDVTYDFARPVENEPS